MSDTSFLFLPSFLIVRFAPSETRTVSENVKNNSRIINLIRLGFRHVPPARSCFFLIALQRIKMPWAAAYLVNDTFAGR